MRRFAPVFVLLLAAVMCLPADAGTSKKFEKFGFSWTAPSDDWQFHPMSSADVNAGFVAKAQYQAASVEVIIYTKPTDGLSLSDRVQELRNAGGEGLGDAVRTKVLDTTLSGVKGKVVVQKIKADGAEGHFRKYAIIADGKFFQMLVRCWHGAHESAKDEINGIRKGFRLLKGAGGADKDESLTEVDNKKRVANPEDGSSDDEDDSSDDEDDGNWPPDGPTKKGKTVCLPSHNMEWTIPEDSPFTWVEGIENEKAKDGMFLRAQARLKRTKKEFEKNTPDFNDCIVRLFIRPTNVGEKPNTTVKSSQLQDEIRKEVFGGEVNAQKTRTKWPTKFGNHKAGYLKMEGEVNGRKTSFLFFQSILKGETYNLQVRIIGHTDRMKQFGKPLAAFLRGIKFLDLKEPQRGPLMSIIPDFAAKRGSSAGTEKEFRGPGYTFKKPEWMAQLKPGGQALSMNRDFKHAFEGRSKDGDGYVYVEIRSQKAHIPNRPGPDPEKMIEKRGQDWLAGAGEGAEIGGKKGKLKYKKGGIGSAKGFTYTFTGELEKAPFTEQGWIVKHKGNLIWVRIQMGGGKKGETALKKDKRDAKKVLKFIKFKK